MFTRFRAQLLVLLLIFSHFACDKDKDPEPISPPDNPPDVIIPKTTKILDQESIKAIDEVDKSFVSFTRSTTMIDSISVGDIIATGISEKTPLGLLVKVLSKQKDNGKTTFTVTQAKLTEAVQKGRLTISQNLSFSDTLGRTAADAFIFKFPIKPYGDIIFFNANLSVQPKLDFNIDIDDFTLQELSYSITLSNQLLYEITLNGDINIADDWVSMRTWEFKSFTTYIGLLPVVLHPELSLQRKMEGKINSNTTWGYTGTNKTTIGAIYKAGTWRETKSVENKLDQTLPKSPKIGGDLKGYIGLRFELAAYLDNALEVYTDVNKYLRLNVNIWGNPYWSLYEGTEANIGINSILFDKRFTDFSKANIYKNENLLASGKKLSIQPENQDGKINEELQFNAVFENLPSSYKYEWDFGDKSPPKTILNNGSITHKYTKEGSYEIVATLINTDVDEAITIGTAKVNINASEPEPKVFVITPTEGLIDVNYTFKAEIEGQTEIPTGLTYEWNFGNKTEPVIINNRNTVNYKYSNPGDYMLTLIVKDENGGTLGKGEAKVNIITLAGAWEIKQISSSCPIDLFGAPSVVNFQKENETYYKASGSTLDVKFEAELNVNPTNGLINIKYTEWEIKTGGIWGVFIANNVKFFKSSTFNLIKQFGDTEEYCDSYQVVLEKK